MYRAITITSFLPLSSPPPLSSPSPPPSPPPPPFRLQTALAEKESDYAEAMSAMEAKHNSEMQKTKELLAASEATNTDLQKEVSGI